MLTRERSYTWTRSKYSRNYSLMKIANYIRTVCNRLPGQSTRYPYLDRDNTDHDKVRSKVRPGARTSNQPDIMRPKFANLELVIDFHCSNEHLFSSSRNLPDTINLNAISKNNRNSVNFFFFFFLRHVSHWKFICTVNFESIKIQINLRFISRTIREICNRTLLSHFRKRSSLFSKTCKKK